MFPGPDETVSREGQRRGIGVKYEGHERYMRDRRGMYEGRLVGLVLVISSGHVIDFISDLPGAWSHSGFDLSI